MGGQRGGRAKVYFKILIFITMPIFDYSCNCGNVKLDEIVRSYKDAVKCDICGEEMERAISAPNLVGFDSNGTSKSGKK